MKKYSKFYTSAIAATLVTSALVAVVPTQAAPVTFKDVDKSNQFLEYITNLAERGIITGYGDDTFRPTLEVRRDHAAKIIAGILDLNTTSVKNPEFTDVPVNYPQYGAIAAMKEAGIISGDGYGKFLPEKSLTRGEMAKIIANAFDLKVPAGSSTPFTDTKGNMFENYITALYVNDVTRGTGNNKFDPSGIVTREQLAAFVVRAESIASGVVDKEAAVVSIDGDTVVINGEVLALTEELKAVFNKNNAAALAGAKVGFIVRYTDSPVASLTPIANNGQGVIVGIKSIELPNASTTFNAGGFVVPAITVTAAGITISNVAISTFTVAKGATVTLENVVADSVSVAGSLTLGEGSIVTELNLTGDAKITLTEGVKLEKIILEKGKTLADVITNHAAFADLLGKIKVEEFPPASAGSGGGAVSGSGSGGSSGGSSDDQGNQDSKDKPALTEAQKFKTALVNEFTEDLKDNDKIDFTSNANYDLDQTVITIKVDGGLTYGEVAGPLVAYIEGFIAKNTIDIVRNLDSVEINGVTYDFKKVSGALNSNSLNTLGKDVMKGLAIGMFGEDYVRALEIKINGADKAKVLLFDELDQADTTIKFNYADKKTDLVKLIVKKK